MCWLCCEPSKGHQHIKENKYCGSNEFIQVLFSMFIAIISLIKIYYSFSWFRFLCWIIFNVFCFLGASYFFYGFIGVIASAYLSFIDYQKTLLDQDRDRSFMYRFSQQFIRLFATIVLFGLHCKASLYLQSYENSYVCNFFGYSAFVIYACTILFSISCALKDFKNYLFSDKVKQA